MAIYDHHFKLIGNPICFKLVDQNNQDKLICNLYDVIHKMIINHKWRKSKFDFMEKITGHGKNFLLKVKITPFNEVKRKNITINDN